MLEQVYELSLPKFSEIVNENFKGFSSQKRYEYVADNTNLDAVLKKQWLNFLDIDWKGYKFFKKSEFVGSIHSDLGRGQEDFESVCIWGINWVFDGSGKIEFWNYNSVKIAGITLGTDNDPAYGKVPKYDALTPPDFEYLTLENKVYLVNASLPHRATGYFNRKVFSLRPASYKVPWSDIVEKFKNYIVT